MGVEIRAPKGGLRLVDSVTFAAEVDISPHVEGRVRSALRETPILEIRDFRPEDAAACHELRRAAFLGIFGTFLSQEAVQAGADSYSLSEFSERIGAMTTVVASVGDAVVGFCSVRMISRTRGELLYLYVGANHRATGIGAALALQAEQRISESNPELEALFLDTAVPEYNQLFWERMGYRFLESSVCEYPTGRIPAARLEKRVNRLAPAAV